METIISVTKDELGRLSLSARWLRALMSQLWNKGQEVPQPTGYTQGEWATSQPPVHLKSRNPRRGQKLLDFVLVQEPMTHANLTPLGLRAVGGLAVPSTRAEALRT